MKSPYSLAGRVASGIEKKLANKSFISKGNVVYRPDSKIIMRGLFIESTPYKKTIYVRNLYGVLIEQANFVSLDFSERVTNSKLGKGRNDFCGAVSEIVQDALSSINDSNTLTHLNDDDAIDNVRAKLAYAALPNSKNLEAISVLAALSLIRGDLVLAGECYEKCKKVINSMQQGFISDHHAKLIDQIELDVDTFQVNPTRLVSILHERAHLTASRLGFQVSNNQNLTERLVQ